MKHFANVASVMLVAVIALSLFSAAKVYERKTLASQDGIEYNSVNVVDHLAVMQQAAPQAVPEGVAKIEIKSPEHAPVGTLVEIDASSSIAQSIKWHISPADQWRVVDDGRKVYVTSGQPQDLTITVAAALDGTVDLKVLNLTFERPAPAPTPEPVKPLSAFAKELIDHVAHVPESEAKRTKLVALASNFETVANLISTNILKSPEDVIAATAKLNKETIGSDEAAWQFVKSAIQAELNKRAEAGTLRDMKQHEDAWREIAIILKHASPV
ncbi:MAG: hypothetical protein ACTHK7_15975 [Aureliella sp.]